MTWNKTLGIVLIAAGIFALIYGGFTYTEDRHEIDIGPIELQASEQETVNIPVWAGAGALILGVVFVAYPMKRR